MGKGSSEIEETSAEKAAAGVAKEQWDLYKNELSQYEDQFMEKVDDLNSEQNYDNLAGDTNLAYQQAFTQARSNTADSLASAGVDPTSGKYKATMDDLTEQQIGKQIDTTNRVQTDQANKYVAGLQDVVSMGVGQKAEALSGYDSIATNAQKQAISDASTAQSNASATAGAVGTVAGAGLAAYFNADGTKKDTTNSSKISPIASVLQGIV